MSREHFAMLYRTSVEKFHIQLGSDVDGGAGSSRSKWTKSYHVNHMKMPKANEIIHDDGAGCLGFVNYMRYYTISDTQYYTA